MENQRTISHVLTGGNCVGGVETFVALLAQNQPPSTLVYAKQDTKNETFFKEQLGDKYKPFSSFSSLVTFFFRLVYQKNINLHAHLGQALVLCALLKFLNPTLWLVYTEHLLVPHSFTKKGIKNVIKQKILTWSLNQCDQVHAVTDVVKSELINRGCLVPIVTIFPGVKSESETSLLTKVELPLKLIVVARLELDKNPRDVIEVARYLDSEKFTINWFGDGSLKQTLAAEIKALNLKTPIHLRGHVQSLNNHWKNAHLFLSTSRRESAGLALMEAAQAGIPFVGYGHVAARELLNETCAVFVDVFEPEMLAKELLLLANDSQKIAVLSESARLRAKEFSYPRFLQKMESLYR